MLKALAAERAADPKNIIRYPDQLFTLSDNRTTFLPSTLGADMAKVHAIGRTEIRVYANDHLPPHFHIVNPDFEALIEIKTFAIHSGSVGKGSAGKAAMAWAKANIAALTLEWNRINPRFPIK